VSKDRDRLAAHHPMNESPMGPRGSARPGLFGVRCVARTNPPGFRGVSASCLLKKGATAGSPSSADLRLPGKHGQANFPWQLTETQSSFFNGLLETIPITKPRTLTFRNLLQIPLIEFTRPMYRCGTWKMARIRRQQFRRYNSCFTLRAKAVVTSPGIAAVYCTARMSA
jgi:hypothetical protein